MLKRSETGASGLRPGPDIGRAARPFPLASWLLVAAAVLSAIVFLWHRSTPPSELVIAAGPRGGGHHTIAERYKKRLARHNIRMRIVETSGAVQNLDLIARAGARVDVALVQGGLAGSEPSVEIASVGRMFFEPLWIFHRTAGEPDRLSDFKGLRLAIGGEGTGTRVLVHSLLAANGITPGNSRFDGLASQQAANALMEGRIDALFVVAAIEAPIVQSLLESSLVKTASLERASAYGRVFPYLTNLTLPRGAIDLLSDLPARDIQLVAPTAALVVRRDLHPALVYILTEVANEVHNERGLLGQIDAALRSNDPEYEMADAAMRFHRQGTPFLHRHFSFWIADFIERALAVFLPLAAIVFPVAGILPRIYQWTYRRKFMIWYRRLREIEMEMRQSRSERTLAAGRARLDGLQVEIKSSRLPIGFSEQLYTLHEHIDIVRDSLSEPTRTAREEPAAAEPTLALPARMPLAGRGAAT